MSILTLMTAAVFYVAPPPPAEPLVAPKTEQSELVIPARCNPNVRQCF